MIGVLALQGAFIEHERILRRLGHEVCQVRSAAQLDAVERLIIPGGESTTIGHLLVTSGLLAPIRARAQHGMPVWGTCAGMILLAKTITDGRPAGQTALELMDITARRNAFGRQRESFEADLSISQLGALPFHAVFIRAPLIEETHGAALPIATLPDGRIVAVQQGHLLATSFHPELTADDRLHRYFAAL